MILTMLTCLAAIAFAQRTPTMGWSSWNTFALNINENLIKGQADAMHQNGLQKALQCVVQHVAPPLILPDSRFDPAVLF